MFSYHTFYYTQTHILIHINTNMYRYNTYKQKRSSVKKQTKNFFTSYLNNEIDLAGSGEGRDYGGEGQIMFLYLL